MSMEEDLWKQRAKCHWLEGGDSNSRFFHAMASSRNRTNRIEGLYNSTGSWVSNQEDICSRAKAYFNSLFVVDQNWQEPNLSFIKSRVPRDESIQLSAPFSIDEFKNALFQMHPDKSSEPDGLNVRILDMTLVIKKKI